MLKRRPILKEPMTSFVLSLLPIRGFMKGTGKFPIQKCAIFRKFKEISGIARRHTAVCRTSDSAD